MAKIPVFISWSGRRSKAVANALRLWLEDVLQGTKPWMSDSDIDKGARWGAVLADQLRTSSIGIICLTPENLASPWLLFEAGALSKIVDDSFVCTLLLDLVPGAVPQPLGTFQATQANKDDVLKLLSTINAALGDDALSAEQLGRIFARSWPDLEQRLTEIKALETETPIQTRDTNELVAELIQLVRSLDAKLTAPREYQPPPGYAPPGPSQYPGYPPPGPSRRSDYETPYPTPPKGGKYGGQPPGGYPPPEGALDNFVSQTKEAVARAEQSGSLAADEECPKP